MALLVRYGGIDVRKVLEGSSWHGLGELIRADLVPEEILAKHTTRAALMDVLENRHVRSGEHDRPLSAEQVDMVERVLATQ